MKGPEHAGKPAAGPRCLGRCVGGPARQGESLTARTPISSGSNLLRPERHLEPVSVVAGDVLVRPGQPSRRERCPARASKEMSGAPATALNVCQRRTWDHRHWRAVMRGNSHVRFGEEPHGNDPCGHRAARLTPRRRCSTRSRRCPGLRPSHWPPPTATGEPRPAPSRPSTWPGPPVFRTRSRRCAFAAMAGICAPERRRGPWHVR